MSLIVRASIPFCLTFSSIGAENGSGTLRGYRGHACSILAPLQCERGWEGNVEEYQHKIQQTLTNTCESNYFTVGFRSEAVPCC